MIQWGQSKRGALTGNKITRNSICSTPSTSYRNDIIIERTRMTVITEHRISHACTVSYRYKVQVRSEHNIFQDWMNKRTSSWDYLHRGIHDMYDITRRTWIVCPWSCPWSLSFIYPVSPVLSYASVESTGKCTSRPELLNTRCCNPVLLKIGGIVR